MAKPTYTSQKAKPGEIKWVDVDPDIQFTQHAIRESGLSVEKIAEKSGCCRSTVNNILKGATRKPQNATIRNINEMALGYERVWMKNGRIVKW
jgi:predicted transcriptional regulator